MDKCSIDCRSHGRYVYENPFPFINGEVVITEDGERKFVEAPPVSRSLASDFSISVNAMYNRLGSPSRVREVFDPVDMGERHPEIL